MKLSQKVITKILDQESGLRLKLAATMKFTEGWIRTLAYKNKDNGPLTTAAALGVIRKEMKLKDSEILEEAETELAATGC